MNTQQDLQELKAKSISMQNMAVDLLNLAEEIQEDVMIMLDDNNNQCNSFVKITEPRFMGYSELFKRTFAIDPKEVIFQFGGLKIPIVSGSTLRIPSETNQALQDLVNQTITTEFGKRKWTHNGVQSVCNLNSLSKNFDMSISFVIFEPKDKDGNPLSEGHFGKPRLMWDVDADPYLDKAESDKVYLNRWYFGESCEGRFDDVIELLEDLPALDGFNLGAMNLDRDQTEAIAEILLRDCKGEGFRADFRGGDLSDATKQEFINRGWQTVLT